MKALEKLSLVVKRNILDKAGRLDTGRIGQFIGLISISILTWVALVWYLQGKSDRLATLAVLMGSSGIPMILYRVKDFIGSNTTGFDYPDNPNPEDVKKCGFLGRNFTDGKGRLDTGRIGQVQGVVVAAIALTYTMYKVIFCGEPVDITHLEIVCGASGFSMVLYRLKDFAQKYMEKKAGTQTEQS